MSPRDPWLAQRLHAVDRQRRAEARVFAGVIEAMTVWLDAARALVLGQPLPPAALQLLDSPPALTAAAEPDIDAARGAAQVWARGVAEHVDPALSEAFGEGFLDAARRADISPLPFQLDYLEHVHDRLKIWPEGAFEELRPELLEMLSEGMDYDQMTERIGRILNIDAPTRRIRAEISEIDRQLADPDSDLSRADKAALRARKRALWDQHDESLQQWQWLARRIARTETHGAIEGGALAAAQAVAAAGGTATYKRWLSTTDERTRGTHVVADGQMVKLHEPFQVGRARLQHPGEAGGPAGEVINCRCTTMYLREDEVQDALQGVWGGRGVGPGHARIGPDDEDDAATALDRWQREQRGEVVDDLTPDESGHGDGDHGEDQGGGEGGHRDDQGGGEGQGDEHDHRDDNLDDTGEHDDHHDDLGDGKPEDLDPGEHDDGHDEVDDFFAQFDTTDDEPDHEHDAEDLGDFERGPILSASTHDQIQQAQRALPDDMDGWQAITAPREIRPRETFLERSIWENQRTLDRMDSELAAMRADPRLAPFRDLDSNDLWTMSYRRQREQSDLEGKLSRARSQRSIEKISRDLARVREERELIEGYMNLQTRIEVEQKALHDMREDPPTGALWSRMQPALTESPYLSDSYGNLLPPAELDAHLDSVLAVGESMWADIAAAMETDAVLRAARLAEDARPQSSQDIFDRHRERVRIEAEIIRAALAEVRKFGGHAQQITTTIPAGIYPDPNDPLHPATQQVIDNFRAAEQMFPRAWLEAADNRGELVLAEVKRAFFGSRMGGNGRDLLTGSAPGSFGTDYDGAFTNYEEEVACHELGHRMEQAVAGLTALEYALVRRRATVHGNLESSREIYPGSGEMALKDKWIHAYAGKTYSPSSRDPARIAHEAFQVGLQDLFGRSLTRYGDPDGGQLTWFMIAALVLL
ncbi:phage minor head protein [Nocardia sp. NPDC059246]|uniref:phage minor head protein n=1 Tax=unclassified Nocardia TaxID=2637762 RepID=UPI0036867ABB